MTEIKVILDTEKFVELYTLTAEERSLIFEQIGIDNKYLSLGTIESFEASTNELISIEVTKDKPILKELLIRKIINLGRIFINNIKSYNVAIIPTIEIKKNYRNKYGASEANKANKDNKAIASEANLLDLITGGAFVNNVNNLSDLNKTNKQSQQPVVISFDLITVALTKLIRNTYEYNIPVNENVNVMSINCDFSKFINNKLKPKSMDNVLFNGKYTHDFISRNFSDLFILPIINNIKYTISTDDKLKQSEVFDRLLELENYHATSGYFIYAQIRVAILHNLGNLGKLFQVNKKREKSSVDSVTSIATPINKLLESLGNFKFTAGLPLLADVSALGLGSVYYNAVNRGIDSKKTNLLVTEYKHNRDRIAFMRHLPAQVLARQNKINIYMSIIGKKLGTKTLKHVELEMIKKPVKHADNVLDKLKPTEQQVVKAEYNRMEKYVEGYLHNKCPHVIVLGVFNTVTADADLREVFADLSEFFGEKTQTKLIPCNNCEYDVICPHVRDYTELELRRATYIEIKAAMTKYIATIEKTHDQPTEILCKICGGVISSLDIFDLDDTGETVTMDKELADQIWKEVAILTKYIKKNSLVNMSQLITMTRNAIYPYIFEINKMIVKSKTNTAEETRHKQSLYITIYTFAHLLHVVQSTKDIEFKDFNKQSNSKNVLVDLIKHVIEIIMVSKNITIREIQGMNRDIIKNVLIDAYKSLSGSNKVIQMVESEEILTTILSDPVYNYYYSIYLLEQLELGKKAPKNKYGPVDAVDTIIGSVRELEENNKNKKKQYTKYSKLEQVDKTNDIFGRARVPNLNNLKSWKESVAKFSDIKKLDYKIKYSDISATIKATHMGYIVQSFELFNEYIKSRLYTEPMFVDTMYVEPVDVSAKINLKEKKQIVKKSTEMDVQFREHFEKYFAKTKKLLALESNYLQYKQILCQHAYHQPPLKPAKFVIREKLTHLGRIYDETGKLHDWSIYVVNSDNSELTIKQINEQIGKQFKIVDKKCSICGIKMSLAHNVNTLDDKKILTALSDIRKKSNFFQYFEYRCPEGGLHEYGDTSDQSTNSSCTKCGLVKGEQTAEYYKKYMTKTKEKSKQIISEDITIKDITSKETTEYPPFTFNFNLILDLANKLKINYHLVTALGSIEGRDYATVANGEYIPPEVSDRHAPRIYNIKGMIKNLVTEWNQLRWYSKWLKPTLSLQSIIAESGVPIFKIPELFSILPDIYNDFNSHFNYIQSVSKPRDILSFCLQSLCEMLLVIYNDNEKLTEKLRRDFVHYFVKKILYDDELLTQYGYFNWSALYGDAELSDRERPQTDGTTAADTTNVDAGDGSEDDDKPLQNNFDMEDDDIDNDDDAENQVALEGYGLD